MRGQFILYFARLSPNDRAINRGLSEVEARRNKLGL
jgi:hypothetical protein